MLILHEVGQSSKSTLPISHSPPPKKGRGSTLLKTRAVNHKHPIKEVWLNGKCHYMPVICSDLSFHPAARLSE